MSGWLLLVPSRVEAARLGLDGQVALPEGWRAATCGVGVVEAALGADRALRAGPPPVGGLLLGLAGTRDPARAPLGTLVTCAAVVDEAVGAGVGEGFVPLAAMGIPGEEVTPERIDLVEGPGGTGSRLAAGTVASTSATPEEAAGWLARHPDAVLEEMEGWAVASVFRRRGVPLAMWRAVSNHAGDRDVASWSFDEAFAALAAALEPALAGARP